MKYILFLFSLTSLNAQGPVHGSGGGGVVTALTIAGTSNQITASGTCISTSAGTCTLSIPFGLLITGSAATSTTNGLKVTDLANNVGTGIIGYFTSASGSAATPFQADANGVGWKVHTDGSFRSVGGGAGSIDFTTTLFANLGTPSNGRILYCSDCTIASPCAGSGNGAFAKRLNGVWVCN